MDEVLGSSERSASPRRRRGRDELIVIAWRDIPAQINARISGEVGQYILPRRFQKGIDRAAMIAGKRTASHYVSEWTRATRLLEEDGFASAFAAAEAEGLRVEKSFPIERINAFVSTGGWSPERTDLAALLALDVAARAELGEDVEADAMTGSDPDDDDNDEYEEDR